LLRVSYDGPLTPMPDGVRVAIRLTPRARTDRLVAVAATAGGGRVVKASVTAPPEDGRANEALLQLLAKAWQLPRRDLAIVGGAASRQKTVHISGDPQLLVERLGAVIAALPGP
jgi:uncharacterized protein (TIGR00251 family)